MTSLFSSSYKKVRPFEKYEFDQLRWTTLPDLAEIQKNSFEWFLKEGLSQELKAFSPVKDYTGRLELYFLHDDYIFEEHTEEKKAKTPAEARENDQSYTKKFYTNVRLVDRETGEVKESSIYQTTYVTSICNFESSQSLNTENFLFKSI